MAQQYDTFEASESTDPNHCKHTMQHLEARVKKQQKELPPMWFLNATLVPTFINMLVNYIRSADIHYRHGSLSFLVCVLILLSILVCWGVPLYNSTPSTKKFRIYVFIMLTCIAAWFTGMILGDFNYQRYFRHYFDYIELEHYPNTDPSLYHGQQFLDAGTIAFSKGSHLDLQGGFGFKNVDTYCVAPIASPLERLGGFKNFDFWAVGKNCCSGHVADFQCGDYNNPSKWMSGLRMLSAKDRNYYRLAVEGACAANSITAHYPVFFHWVEHPEEEIKEMVERGWSYYARETVSFVLFQCCALVLALIVYI